MRSFAALVLSVCVVLGLLTTALVATDDGGPQPSPMAARALAEAGPVAVIEPLPDEVSNGTWCLLDARNSTYANGTVDHFYWEFYLKGVLKNTYEQPVFEHKFRQLGLWKIFLTITTSDNKTDKSFTAVYSIPDADADLLPDWWEIFYFNATTQTGEGDPDSDGYTNLQEYASGYDPTSKDSGAFMAAVLDAWYYLVVIAAVLVVAFLVVYSRLKRKRKANVKKQIEAALEIEKALEEDK